MPEPRTTRAIPFSRNAVADAMPDFLCLRANMRLDDPDPVALHLISREMSLFDIAAHLRGLPAGSSGPAAHRSLNDSDFGTGLTLGMSKAAAISYAETAAEHVPLLWDVQVRDLRPTALPTIDVGELAKTPDSGGPITIPIVTPAAGLTGQPYVWSAALLVSRRLLVNDSADLLAVAIAQLAAHAARVEAESIVTTIAANPVLADGLQMFVAANTTTGGPTPTGLGAAMALLRTATSPSGNKLNLRASLWLVPAADEVIALATVRDVSIDGPRLRVIPNAWLPAGTSYVMASPQSAPVFARFALNPGAPPTIIEKRSPPDFDGRGYRIEAIVGVSAAGLRAGIVRITT